MQSVDIVRAALVGIGGTIVLDLYAALMARVFGMPATNWAMVGRWIGHMPGGRFVQPGLGKAAPVPGELAIGWGFHYAVGVAYGLLLVAIWGAEWLREPTLAPPLILVLALLVLPYFVMMPGMGMGIAASRTPAPNVARLMSVVGHSIFGVGMYLTATLIAAMN
ncbi:MAG: DUF2938 domain-containing protein [Gammaproteobacteria bacterium]